MQYQRDRELDACGIGFVADAQGRSSRHIVSAALAGLAKVIHRGALAADAKSADGSGVLTPIPAAIYGGHGVAQLFVRGDVAEVQAAVKAAAAEERIDVADWREPPVDDAALGEQALASKPVLLQALLVLPDDSEPGGAAAERAALRLRRRLILSKAPAYVASCSFRTVVHKGLVAANRLGDFWLDLQDERFEASFTVFHQRFSTNTLPTWERAQPFRTLCHNGEINAIAGNLNRMRARAKLGTEDAGLGPEELFRPVLEESGSDSAMLDNAIELLTRGGRDIRHAVAMLVPEAWEGVKDLDSALEGFYRYHASLVEPWDGPAGLVFSDGLSVGASLDRNGLRPLRYAVCEDGLVTCCSEAGAIDVEGHGTVTRGRLGPGEMLFVDPSRGVLIDHDCKQRLAAAGPYARWADDGLVPLSSGQPTLETPDPDDLVRRQAAHGYTTEELRMVLKPMRVDAKEPVFSMGDDAPLPHLAGNPRPVHHYLRQRFAQVTNPPIDHLRERPVMSLRTLLGPRAPLLAEGPEACHQAELPSFFLFPEGVATLTVGEGSTAVVDACFPLSSGAAGLRESVERIAADVEREVAMGATVVVLDDCALSPELAPIPSLLALGATHARLIRSGMRDEASLVVVADDVRDVHHVACLLGYGADAICPRLALATVASEADASEDSDVLSPEAQERYQAAVEDGVLKVMSKMGISTVDSYRGAQVFEAIGLGPEVLDVCFPGTPSTTG
ncbi:MAG: glutamate synthase central domain-containing protein, partial [Acidimicrobiales bacterium]